MKYISHIAAALLAALTLFTSCKKDDTIRYGNMTLGNFAGDLFISDQGNEFSIVENNSGQEFNDAKRGIMVCDVLKKVEGTTNGYEVRVTDYLEVLTKSPVEAAEAALDADKLVEDPIMIAETWVSGGYINMYVMFEVQVNPKKEDSQHMVNLVFTESDKGTGKYSFTLRHNSFGETLNAKEESGEGAGEGSGENAGEGAGEGSGEGAGEGSGESQKVATRGTNPVQWAIAGAYVSFQVSDLIQEDTAEITLNWLEHAIIGNEWTAETTERSYKLSYDKKNFEQVPLTLKTKTAVLK